MMFNSKQFLAIAVFALFTIVLANDKEVLAFLSKIAGKNPDQVTAAFQKHTARFGAAFEKEVSKVCKLHYRDLLLKQILQFAAAFEDEDEFIQQYRGCVAIMPHDFPQSRTFTNSRRHQCEYFDLKTSALLEALGKLAKEEIDQLNVEDTIRFQMLSNKDAYLGRAEMEREVIELCKEEKEALAEGRRQPGLLAAGCDYVVNAAVLIHGASTSLG